MRRLLLFSGFSPALVAAPSASAWTWPTAARSCARSLGRRSVRGGPAPRDRRRGRRQRGGPRARRRLSVVRRDGADPRPHDHDPHGGWVRGHAYSLGEVTVGQGRPVAEGARWVGRARAASRNGQRPYVHLGRARRVGSERLRRSARPAPGTRRRTARPRWRRAPAAAPCGRSSPPTDALAPTPAKRAGWETPERPSPRTPAEPVEPVHGGHVAAPRDHRRVRRGDRLRRSRAGAVRPRKPEVTRGPDLLELGDEARRRAAGDSPEHPSARGGPAAARRRWGRSRSGEQLRIARSTQHRVCECQCGTTPARPTLPRATHGPVVTLRRSRSPWYHLTGGSTSTL